MIKIKHDPPLVLVADDEVSAATMLRHVFEREGYRVEIAHDGLAAVDMARALLPDLVILDIMMPQMNGFEVLRHLRDYPVTSGIPTIVVSARAKEPSDVAMGLNIGADDYMSKPFAPQELLARARSKMRARQLEETLQQRTHELEAMLRVSDELNKHLDFDELLSLIMHLTLELLHGDFAMICRLDSDMEITAASAVRREDAQLAPDDASDIVVALQQYDAAALDDTQLDWLGLEHIAVRSLDHGAQRLGLLIIGSSGEPYDANHLMLLGGICRQAGLALHNAEMYEIQTNYALHLEDMVVQRTEELKATQQMLLRSEKLASIGHLAASIAHEINNPLQPIRLNLDFLMEDIQAGNTIDTELVEMTQGSVERIGRIVRQLLEFTKTGGDTGFSEVDVVNVLETVLRLNRKVFEQENIDLVVEIDDLPAITANKDQLEQVFMNLLINARAAMPGGGQMSVRAWQENQKVRVQFEDTGVGIPEDMLEKIFEPFVSTKQEGTGLGLFVTYGIVENHQGEIDVRSREGLGTTFTITLPMAMTSSASAAS
ncbi:MAG: ATP-binding protein [Chloroflexota bacterium]